jgi:hypothetical protein
MNIPMPSEQEKKVHIVSIVAEALPPKRSFSGEVLRLFQSIGLKYAFASVLDAVAAAILVSLVVGFTASIYSNAMYTNILGDDHFIFAPILFFAPILYFTLLTFTAWKERMCGTWEVLMSCRYNLKYLTALRVIVVSASGLLFLPLITLPLAGTGKYLPILIGAFCAMFLYSCLTLLFLLISESFAFQLVLPILWVSVWGILLFGITPLGVERFLAGIPLAVSGGLAVSLLLLYLAELRVFILRSTDTAVLNQS